MRSAPNLVTQVGPVWLKTQITIKEQTKTLYEEPINYFPTHRQHKNTKLKSYFNTQITKFVYLTLILWIGNFGDWD